MFSQHVYTPSCAGKIYNFRMFTFLENALNLGLFTYAPPHEKLTSKLLLLHPRQKEITDSHRQHLFQNSVSPTIKKSGANYDLLYKKYNKKMKMSWYIRLHIFCMICIFFKCDGPRVL